MKYFPRLSLSVWALLALLAGSAVCCLSPAWSADQKPLVINPTTGRTEQIQAGNRLSLPDASGDLVTIAPGVQTATRVLSVPVLTGDATLMTLSETQTVTGAKTFSEPLLTTSSFSTVGGASGISVHSLNRNSATGAILNNAFGGVSHVLAASYEMKFYDTAGNQIDVPVAIPVASGAISLLRDVEVTGNVSMIAAGNGLAIKEGSNAKMGASVLVGGTVTVNTTAVTANSRIYLTSQADGGTPGYLRVSARVAATSFTITSGSGTDTSTVAWMIVEPAP